MHITIEIAPLRQAIPGENQTENKAPIVGQYPYAVLSIYIFTFWCVGTFSHTSLKLLDQISSHIILVSRGDS